MGRERSFGESELDRGLLMKHFVPAQLINALDRKKPVLDCFCFKQKNEKQRGSFFFKRERKKQKGVDIWSFGLLKPLKKETLRIRLSAAAAAEQ